jgi:hypothetical protein
LSDCNGFVVHATITMKAEERKPEEKHFMQREICFDLKSILLRCIFLWFVWRNVSKRRPLTPQKHWVASSYDKEKISFMERINWLKSLLGEMHINKMPQL